MANPVVVQTPNGTTFSGSTSGTTVSYPASTTAGNSLFAVVIHNSAALATITVKTAGGNVALTRDEVSGFSAQNNEVEIWRLDNAASTTGLVFTASSGTPPTRVCLFEVSGLLTTGSLDVGGTYNTAGTPESVSTTGPTANAVEFVIAVCANNAIGAPGTATGYTSAFAYSAAGPYCEVDYLITSSAGTQTATWATLGSSGGVIAAIAAYQGAAIGGSYAFPTPRVPNPQAPWARPLAFAVYVPRSSTLTQGLGAAAQPTAAVQKGPAHGQPATLSPGGTQQRAIAHQLAAAALSFAGNAQRGIAHGIAAASLSFSGALITSRAWFSTLTASLTPSATLTSILRHVQAFTQLLTAALSPAGNLLSRFQIKAQLIQSGLGTSTNNSSVTCTIASPSLGNDLILIATCSASHLPTSAPVSVPAGAPLIADAGWRLVAGSRNLAIWRIAAITQAYSSFTLTTGASSIPTLWVGEVSPGGAILQGTAASAGTNGVASSITTTYGSNPAISTGIELVAAAGNATDTLHVTGTPTLTTLKSTTGSSTSSSMVVLDDVTSTGFAAPPTASVTHSLTGNGYVVIMAIYATGGYAWATSFKAAVSLATSLLRGIAHALPTGSLTASGATQDAITSGQVASVSATGSQQAATSHGFSATLIAAGAATLGTARSFAATVSTAGARAPFAIGKSLAAAASFAGTRALAIGHSLAGAINPSGAISRAISHTLPSGALSFAGASASAVQRAFSATLSTAGMAQNATARGFSAAVSFIGTRAPSAITRGFGASVTFVGTRASATGHSLAATLGPQGAVSRAAQRGFAAALSFGGSMIAGHNWTLILAAATSFAATVRRGAGHGLSASVSTAGSIARGAGKLITAGASFTTSRAVSITHTLASASLSFGGQAIKGTQHTLISASASFAGAISTSNIWTKALSATLSATGSVQRGIAHGITAGITASGAVQRGASHTLTAAASFAGAATRTAGHGLSGALATSGAIARDTGHVLTAAASFAGTRSLQIGTRLTAAVSTSPIIIPARVTYATLTASLSWVGATSRQAGKSLLAGMAPTGSTQRAIGAHLTAALTPTGAISRGFARRLTAALSWVGRLVGIHAGAPDIVLHVGAPVSAWTTKAPLSTWTTAEPVSSWTVGPPTGAS